MDVPRSKQFDDVYFSQEGGLAETRHVFLAGNDLPSVWQGRERYVICETGFGTGLNFLALLKMWRDTPEDGRSKHLHFISFEKYPLTHEEILRYLACWNELSAELEILLAVYPQELEQGCGYTMEVVDGITLTLIIGDVNEEIPKLGTSVDCWFLDGFKPSSNPDMWSETVFSNMARLSALGAHMATFTAAGFVRRGLVAAGFEVRKVPGFGRKREICVGTYKGRCHSEQSEES